MRRLMSGKWICLWIGLGAAGGATAATDTVLINRIADAGFNHGEVVDTAAYLADQIGGRMTNSPAMRKAERWTQDKFQGWGLKSVHTEGIAFGRGWWIEASSVRMIAPRPLDLRAIPIAWTPPTSGVLTAPVVVAPIATERDFGEWKGKLAGKIVLVTWPAPPADPTEAAFHRFTDAEVAKLDKYQEPGFDPAAKKKAVELQLLRVKLDSFLAFSEVAALVQVHHQFFHPAPQGVGSRS